MKPATVFSTAAAFLVATIAPFHVASAQDTAEQQLTGGSSREWVFKRVVRSMGPGNSCTSGETYTFAADHFMVSQECKSGHLDAKRFSWRLSNTGNGDTALAVDGLGTFVVLFRDTPDGAHWMRLRTRGEGPPQPTVDKEFRLNED